MTIPRTRIYFIPPPQAHEAAPSYVFQVVEIGSEEEHCYYEDEDAAVVSILSGVMGDIHVVIGGGKCIGVLGRKGGGGGGIQIASEQPDTEEIDEEGCYTTV